MDSLTPTQKTPLTPYPKRVFIIPYRNRPQQKYFFCKYMSFLLEEEGKDDYEMLFIHQCDARTFNRGAIKNIGFVAVQQRYPEHYRSITLIFNDVDTLPFANIFDYETVQGSVKHYYGYRYALGGIVVIKAGDFERTNGFPGYWGWGMEDNAFQKRCLAVGLTIDRDLFYPIGSPEILQLFDGISRIISKKDPWREKNDNGSDGLSTLTHLLYTIDETSKNPNDNIFVVQNPRIAVVNVNTFLTQIPFETEDHYHYDLREPKRKIVHPDRLRPAKRHVTYTTDWTSIPYYPTTREARLNMAKALASTGQPLSADLVAQLAADRQADLTEDAFYVPPPPPQSRPLPPRPLPPQPRPLPPQQRPLQPPPRSLPPQPRPLQGLYGSLRRF